MEIETLALATITPYWRNPRISDKAVEAVKQSIQDYGFINPIILDKDNVIIAGHTRYLALMSLGYAHAACLVTDLTPEQAKAYRIADNKTSELAEWDKPLLIAELREVLDLPRMKIYFPDMNLSTVLESIPLPKSVSLGPSAISQATIDQKTEAAENRFQSVPQKVLLDIHCPHCHQSFAFDPNYFIGKQS